MAKKKPPTKEAIKLCAALITLAEESGLQITITIPPQEMSATSTSSPLASELVPADEMIKERQKSDLAWLTSHLTRQGGESLRLSGNYVAVFNQEIVSVGDNNKLVRLSAAEAAQVTPQEILVVPIKVSNPEAEEDWSQVKHDLGLA